MKRMGAIVLLITLFIAGVHAQTPEQMLLGKWKLVKWTKKGVEKNILKEFKTEDVYQVFDLKNKFISVVGEKENKGKWKLLKNEVLSIRSGLVVVDFHIDYMDTKTRKITSEQVGTLEYVKVIE